MGRHKTEGWENGRHYSLETEFKKGCIPWNKGLTKEIDERVRKNAEKTHKKLKERNYYKGIPHPKMKGRLSRENNPMWKGRKLRYCIYCGEQFEVAPWQERNKKRFCSHRCRARWYGKQEDFREKQRNAKLGEKNPNYGKPKSLEVRMKIKRSNLEAYSKPETWSNWLKGTSRRPTSCEKEFIQIVEENDFPFRYVGNGAFNIGTMCPDFIHNNDQKKVIEVFGDYWHTKGGRDGEEERKEKLKKLGWECLVIWEHELKNKDYVTDQVRLFLNA